MLPSCGCSQQRLRHEPEFMNQKSDGSCCESSETVFQVVTIIRIIIFIAGTCMQWIRWYHTSDCAPYPQGFIDHIEILTPKFILSYPSRNSRSENPLFLQKQEVKKKKAKESVSIIFIGKTKISRGSCSSWLAGGAQSTILRCHSHSHSNLACFHFPQQTSLQNSLFQLGRNQTKKFPAQIIYLLLGAEREKFMLKQNLTLFNIKNQHYCA